LTFGKPLAKVKVQGGLKKMKKILAGLILAGGTMFAGPAISVGIGVGVPVAPAPVYVAPGPGYIWTPGYFYFSGGHRLWRAGFWAPPVHGGRFAARGFRR
jgi:hypothetical protein